MRAAERIIGQRFNKLVVTGADPVRRDYVVCLCDCGKIHKARSSHVVLGRTKSCGCGRTGFHHNTLEDVLVFCDKGAPDDCWPWKACIKNSGYGSINFRGVEMLASRAVFTAIHGAIPGDLLVCHRCDNPPCVNPKHLFIGTYHDNVKDMLKKGRGRWVTVSKPHEYCRKGHLLAITAYSPPSTPGKRICGVCMRDRANAWRRKKVAERRAAHTAPEKP